MSKLKNQQLRELQSLVAEATALSSKETLTKQEERRHSLLLSEISLVKQGHSLAEIQHSDLNDREARGGLPLTPLSKVKGRKKEKRAKDFMGFIEEASRTGKLYGPERRGTGTEGNAGLGSSNGTAEIGSYAGLGFFVPADFMKDTVKMALKLGDEILREDVSTVIHSNNGRPLAVPISNDTAEDAVPVGEGALDTVNTVEHPNHLILGAQSFRQTFVTSLESVQDVEAAGDLLNVWQRWTAERTARGVGKCCINGTAAQDGILTSLGNNVTPVIAEGSSANTGGTESGATSIGSVDLAKMYFGLDAMYRNNKNTCWLMNDLTLIQLSSIITKSGQPLVYWQGNWASIFGKPVFICPTIPSPSSSQVTILFGDASYFFVRAINDGMSGIRILKERFADQGSIGFQTITRWGWGLAFKGFGFSPFTVLQQAS